MAEATIRILKRYKYTEHGLVFSLIYIRIIFIESTTCKRYKDTMSNNANPGNFANRPHEDVENIARKGGQSSHQGGFASMDPGDQVCKASSDMKYAAWS